MGSWIAIRKTPSVTATVSDYILTCGTNGQIRYKEKDDANWTILAGPNTGQYLEIFAFDLSNIWVLDATNKKIWYYNGSSWADQHTFSGTDERGWQIAGNSEDELYCISGCQFGETNTGNIYKYDPATGTWSVDLAFGYPGAYSITAKPDDSQIAACGYIPSGYNPDVFRYKNLPGGSWTYDTTDFVYPDNCGIAWDSYNSRYIVNVISGSYGVNLFYGDVGSWTAVTGETAQYVTGRGQGRILWVDPSNGDVFYLSIGFSYTYNEGLWKWNGSSHTFYDMSSGGTDRASPYNIDGVDGSNIYITDTSNANTIGFFNGTSVSFENVQAGGTSATYHSVYVFEI